MLIALTYDPPYRFAFASANGYEYNYQVPSASVFGQARLGVEFGATPWSTVGYRAPKATVPLVTFDRPRPPPYAAEIVTANGSTGGISSWWTDHRVTMTRDGSPGKRAEAAASRLSDGGYRFTVYLEP